MTDREFLEAVRKVHGEFGVRLLTLVFRLGATQQPDDDDLADDFDDESGPVWLNQTQVAEYIGVSDRHLRNMIREGRFPQPETDSVHDKRENLWSEVTVRKWLIDTQKKKQHFQTHGITQ